MWVAESDAFRQETVVPKMGAKGPFIFQAAFLCG